MDKINVKRKGSNFERECARILSLIVSDNKSDSVFWRTAGSGNYATINKKAYQKGDLCVVNPEYNDTRLVFECKCLSGVSIFPMSYKLEHTISDCEARYGNGWVILLRIRNRGTYAISRLEIFSDDDLLVVMSHNGYRLNIYRFDSSTKLNRDVYNRYLV